VGEGRGADDGESAVAQEESPVDLHDAPLVGVRCEWLGRFRIAAGAKAQSQILQLFGMTKVMPCYKTLAQISCPVTKLFPTHRR
jgi:hypothetical protein